MLGRWPSQAFRIDPYIGQEMRSNLICGDCLECLTEYYTIIFADPPDNIGLSYRNGIDNNPFYDEWLEKCLRLFVKKANVVWLSFNARHIFTVGYIVKRLPMILKSKLFIQTFTFGQHNQTDCGNNYRPLLRIMRSGAQLYPDAIRVPSWRQLNKDSRADSRGKVPGDVFDFPRVTGNSKQRRLWHPTQLNEFLVERCLLLTSKEGDSVCDPFGGTGTTLRVCKKINRDCTIIEKEKFYCDKIAKENSL